MRLPVDGPSEELIEKLKTNSLKNTNSRADYEDRLTWLAYVAGAKDQFKRFIDFIRKSSSDPAVFGNSAMIDKNILINRLSALYEFPPDDKYDAFKLMQGLMQGPKAEVPPAIEPTDDMIKQWMEEARLLCDPNKRNSYLIFVAKRAALWGADMELMNSCMWLEQNDPYEHDYAVLLRAARRPSQQSMKQINLKHIEMMERDGHYIPEIIADLRKAVEALPDE